MIVYQHRRLDTNQIFYIGIGKSVKRAYHKRGRNSHWKNIVNKVGYSVEIICTCEDWNEACDIERYLIKYYGRCDLDTGTLVNLTEGGEGVVGNIVSDESKLLMSIAKKGKPSPNKGKSMTEEQKLKISETKKGCDPTVVQVLLDTQTGVYYNSISEASFYYDIKRTTLNAMLSGQNKNKTNLIKI